MSNQMYGKGREKFANGEIDWIDDDIRTVLVDTQTYSVNIDVDEYLDDIPVGERVSTSANLTGKNNTLGTLDADDVTFTTVAGDESEALVIIKWTGNEATSPLLAYIDTATGLPISPNGGDIVIQWDNGANKIMTI